MDDIIENQTTDPRALALIGERLARHRLERNLSQEHVSRQAGVSKRTLERLEAGQGGNLTTLLRVMRALKLLEDLDQGIPEPLPSPIDRLARQGKARQRASGERQAPQR